MHQFIWTKLTDLHIYPQILFVLTICTMRRAKTIPNSSPKLFPMTTDNCPFIFFAPVFQILLHRLVFQGRWARLENRETGIFNLHFYAVDSIFYKNNFEIPLSWSILSMLLFSLYSSKMQVLDKLLDVTQKICKDLLLN